MSAYALFAALVLRLLCKQHQIRRMKRGFGTLFVLAGGFLALFRRAWRTLNASCRIALNFHLDIALGSFFSIGIYATSDGFAQVVLAAVFANFGRYLTNDHHGVVALQRNGGDTGVSMAGLADGAFHHALLILNASSQIVGSGR